MKKLIMFFLLISPILLYGQVETKLVSGQLILGDGFIKSHEKNYQKEVDSLAKLIALHPQDTSAIFFLGLLYDKLNCILAQPGYSETALSYLRRGLVLANKAKALMMQDLKLTILIAQLNKDICYQLAITP